MKSKAKVIDITGKTPAQIEAGLEAYLSAGWTLIQFVVISTKVYAVLSKVLAE